MDQVEEMEGEGSNIAVVGAAEVMDEVDGADEVDEEGGEELRRKTPQDWTPTATSCTLSLLLPAIESKPLTKGCTLLTVPQSHRLVPLFPTTSMAYTLAYHTRHLHPQQSRQSPRNGVGM